MGAASRKVLVVGSGIAGLSAAICAAERGLHVVLVSPYASERAQSVMAAGGINAALDTMGGLFRKATGSRLCDGYAAGQLLSQGVEMRNLEFIQFHPTAIETPCKHMLMTEAARGEGGPCTI